MSLNLLLLCLLLSGSGGLAIGSTLASLFGWIVLIILLVLIWEYKVYIFLFFLALVLITHFTLKYREQLRYKDETPEEREERLKTEKMIKEWRDRNNF